MWRALLQMPPGKAAAAGHIHASGSGVSLHLSQLGEGGEQGGILKPELCQAGTGEARGTGGRGELGDAQHHFTSFSIKQALWQWDKEVKEHGDHIPKWIIVCRRIKWRLSPA